MAVTIIEGVDSTGKGTQIEMLKSEYEKKGIPVHIVHYSSVKGIKDKKKVEAYSKKLYKDMFDLGCSTTKENVIIMDRGHLGESVYSPMYRGYSGDYVFDYENELLGFDWQKFKLILFTGDAKEIIKRDKARGDGQSFTLDLEKKKEELKKFDEAFEKSKLIKLRIDIGKKTPEEIFNEVKAFIFK